MAAFIAFVVHVCVQMYLQRHHSSSDTDNNGKQEIPTDNVIDSLTVDNHITESNTLQSFDINMDDKHSLDGFHTNTDNDDKTKFTNVDLNS